MTCYYVFILQKKQNPHLLQEGLQSNDKTAEGMDKCSSVGSTCHRTNTDTASYLAQDLTKLSVGKQPSQGKLTHHENEVADDSPSPQDTQESSEVPDTLNLIDMLFETTSRKDAAHVKNIPPEIFQYRRTAKVSSL